MRFLALTSLVAAGLAVPATALGNAYVGGGAFVTGGLGGLNFGELIGEPSDGGDDLSGRRGGAFLRAGLVRGPFEIGPRLGIALGGLSRQRIEELYAESEPEDFGNAAVIDAALELRFEQDLGASWTPYAGAALGWERLSAASPSTQAWVDAVFGEVSAGMSWPLGPTPLLGGRLDAAVMLRVSGAYRAHLDGELTRTGDIRYFGSPGIAVSYSYRM